MLTKSGAKLLDFGLAKLTGQGETAALRLAQGPTRSNPLTGEGSIVGTLQYMAPEQLEGSPADARTDLWAVGAILYEMVTGQRAFEGTSAASVMGAILEREVVPLSTRQPADPARPRPARAAMSGKAARRSARHGARSSRVSCARILELSGAADHRCSAGASDSWRMLRATALVMGGARAQRRSRLVAVGSLAADRVSTSCRPVGAQHRARRAGHKHVRGMYADWRNHEGTDVDAGRPLTRVRRAPRRCAATVRSRARRRRGAPPGRH